MAKLTRRGLFRLGAKAVAAVGLAKVLPAVSTVPAAAPLQFAGFSAQMSDVVTANFPRIAAQMMENATLYSRDMSGIFARDAIVHLAFAGPSEATQLQWARHFSPYDRGRTSRDGYLTSRTYAAGEWEGLLAHIDNPDPCRRATIVARMDFGWGMEVA